MADLDQFLRGVLEEEGPQGVVDAFSFLMGSFVITLDGRVVGASRGFTQLMKYSLDELLGMHATELIALDEVPAMHRRFRNSDSEQYQLKLLCKDKSIRHVIVSPRIFSGGDQQYRLAEFVDITPQQVARQLLQESEKKYSSVFNLAAVGIARVAIDGHWLECNDKLCSIVGYDREELLGMSFQDITHPDDLDKDLTLLQQVLDDEIKTYNIEKRYFRKDGSEVWINLTVSLVRGDDHQPEYFISVIEDMNEKKLIVDDLRFQANHDPLTGLLNRKAQNLVLQREIDRAIRYQRSMSVLMLDIDHFKAINDRYGHHQGDVVLKMLASQLTAILRESDIACRFGGEEFLLVLPESSTVQAMETAERIRQQIAVSTLCQDYPEIRVTVSLGIATYPEDGGSPEELVKLADEAMYHAKQTGRNRSVAIKDVQTH
ncbi:MAG: diguanylate cyclase [Proteobacteria bacterium]|nr:diguanylate cyclase [Pseudomonadota bacterium]